MARLLAADGIDTSGFAARRLTETLAAATDLVLTMETGHRTAVVQAHPQALARTFTLREFAHLVAADHEATSTAYGAATQPPACVSSPPSPPSGGPGASCRRAQNRTSTTPTGSATPPTPVRMPRSGPPSRSSPAG